MPSSNAFHQLKRVCEAESTRPYLARGIAVKRCQVCQLGLATCICPWRIAVKSSIDVILIMHRDEVFKPTNTGRLIADVLPDTTLAFAWSRTQPSSDLLSALNDPSRYPVIVFPQDEQAPSERYITHYSASEGRRLTLVVLDGTWKQAKKMFRSSEWLKLLPVMSLNLDSTGQYSVRKAIREGQLSTAEAAAGVLEQCGETHAAQVLSDYFTVFNQHYVATRMQRLPEQGSSHARLLALQARK